jgi:hypothetical protein
MTSYRWLGIPIAVAGAIVLSLGTRFQHRHGDARRNDPPSADQRIRPSTPRNRVMG